MTETAGPFFTFGFGYYSGSAPSSATTRIAYKGFDRIVTDPDNKTTTEKRDYLGRIQSIRDADGRTTTYQYTGAGDMTQSRDPLGNIIKMYRNTLGHMTTLDDPDLGRWTFAYKANGEVKTRKDQQNQTITYWYNDRNQITSKSYAGESPEEPDVSYVYNTAANGKGRLYQVTKGNVTTTYNACDDMGRVTAKTITIDGVDYPFLYAYDAAGNLTRIVHPDNYAVNYSYHNNSHLIATVWADGPDVDVDISDYNNFGKPGFIAYPAFDTRIDYYERTGRVRDIDVPGLMSLSYQYSDAGDVLSVHDQINNGKSFAELAKAISQDKATAHKDGDLGWIKKGAMGQRFSDAAFDLKSDELSEPVETAFGYHLITVHEAPRKVTKSFESVVGVIKNKIKSEARSKEMERLLASIDVKMK